MNKNFLGNLPHNVNDILVINGLVNIINKPTHFTSLVGMHVFAILRNVLVKFEHAELISISASITFSQSVSVILFFISNNLKKQAKQRFYDNINEHLDDLKTVNRKMYWKTIHMLLESNQTLSSLRMVTSLGGMHVFVILRNVLVKFEHAELISSSASITFSHNEHLDDLKTVNSKMYWKTIHMLQKNDRSTNELPPLHDPFNNFNLAYDATYFLFSNDNLG
jgi:hypothetical protein